MSHTDDKLPHRTAAGRAPTGADARDWRPALDDLARALRRWHKLLLDAQAWDSGALGGPFELLHLATTHPDFAWLRPLSGLMAELDELREQRTPVAAAPAGAIRGALDGLMGTAAGADGAFGRRALELVQRTPEIAAAHADVRRLLGGLPRPADFKEKR